MITDSERRKLDDLNVGEIYQITYSDGSDTLCYFSGRFKVMHKHEGKWFVLLATTKVSKYIPVTDIRKIT